MVSPLALSVLSEVQDLIDRFGAYAGFAAIVGLAILTLLYIAQARELKRLREWAGQMPERVGDIQGRITQPAPGPGRVTATPAATPKDQPQTVAGQAAAATTAAVPAAATPAAAKSPAAPVTSETEVATPPVKPTPGQPLVPGKTGADGSRVADDLGATEIHEPSKPINPLDRARRPQTARAAGAAPAAESNGRGPIIGAVIAALAVIAAVVYFVAIAGDDGGSVTRTTEARTVQSTTNTTRSTTSTTSTANNANVSVFVLNGTTINGLARGLANELEKKGFTIKGTETAADQTRSATLVMYAPGKRADAVKVAKSIGKSDDVIEAVDPGSAALSQNASVVVLVGADQNVTNPG